MIEALADGGVKVGLGRDTALVPRRQCAACGAKLQLEVGGLRRTLVDALHRAGRADGEDARANVAAAFRRLVAS